MEGLGIVGLILVVLFIKIGMDEEQRAHDLKHRNHKQYGLDDERRYMK